MIAVIDYGLGNLQSVCNALEAIHVPYVITKDPVVLQKADQLILPGVGAFHEGMHNLNSHGLINILNDLVLQQKKPILGICLGMQLMGKNSEEGLSCDGLGWVDANVIRFKFDDNGLRVPHIGWNDVACPTNSLLFQGGHCIQTFYFVHSYYVVPSDPSICAGTCDYGIRFCAAIQQGNIMAVQFHPEKSQFEGLELLRKFAEISLTLPC